jgi:hypothetical protein
MIPDPEGRSTDAVSGAVAENGGVTITYEYLDARGFRSTDAGLIAL